MEPPIKVFTNDKFGNVRVVQVDGEPWFVAADVCRALEISNSRDAVARLDDDEKGVGSTDTLGGKQGMQIINEPGLYTLVLGSRKPEAKAFKRWVTHEVLPSIRKHGAYLTDNVLEEALASPDFLIQLATQLKEEKEARLKAEQKTIEQEKTIEEQKPKVLFADAVSASKTSILIGDLAKLIRQNGVEVGQKRLFEWLRNNGWLMKSGNSKNMPTQRGMEMKLFEVKEGSYVDSNGVNVVTKTTKVTGKGQQYFVNVFLNGKA